MKLYCWIHTVVDEMLLFQGKCPFKVLTKQKPGKYGILIRMLTDSKMICRRMSYNIGWQAVPDGIKFCHSRLDGRIWTAPSNLIRKRSVTVIVRQ